MDIKIKAIHFDVSQQLTAFIEKKVSKLQQYNEDIISAEVTLKVVKPETVENKDVQIKLLIPNNDLFAGKVANSFEEAVDVAVEALERQLVKIKEKNRPK